ETVRASPDHCVIAAWSHSLLERYEPISGLAHRALELAARGARPHPHVDEVVLHARLLAAAVEATEGCATDDALQEVAEVLATATPGDLPLCASAEIVRGKLLMLRGRYDAALPALRRARELGVGAGSHLLRLAAASGLA